MEKIEINVHMYYDNHEWYKYMPRKLFRALDEAFLNGMETVKVPKKLFDEMIEKMRNDPKFKADISLFSKN